MDKTKQRGVLLHISSLPSNYGIGTFGTEAYRFVDFLSRVGMDLWQVLPLTPTSYGDSPYQSPSAFAGNPYFIDLDILCDEGLINPKSLKGVWGKSKTAVDYGLLYRRRYLILREAYENFTPDSKYDKWRAENEYWLRDYSLFMCVKSHFNFVGRAEWGGLRYRNGEELAMDSDEGFWEFLQFKFSEQWSNLKSYANAAGIKIIGDMPIYVANDSADFWANKDMFLVDNDGEPSLVAGVPPDAFCEDGQLWGNPLYNWQNLRDSGCKWWLDRIWQSLKLFDMVRIDHFRGFESFYAVDADAKTAMNGKWLPAHGLYVFNQVWRKNHNAQIIAEDLGNIDDKVRALVKHTGYPSMKVFQFGFDGDPNNEYLTHNYPENCIAYTGTHDNDTTKGWFDSLNKSGKAYVLQVLDCKAEEVAETMIHLLHQSRARLTVVPMQDYLGLGSEARMNIPSTSAGNWQWRMAEIPSNQFADTLREKYLSKK